MSRFGEDFIGTREEKSSAEERDSADFRISSRGIGLSTPIGRTGERDSSRITFDSIRKDIFTPVGTAFSDSSSLLQTQLIYLNIPDP